MEIINILSRADEFTIEQIIGTQTVKTLNLLSDSPVYNSDFKKLIIKFHRPEEILSDKNLRDIILDLLKEEEITTLARILGKYKKEDSLTDIYQKVKFINYRKGSKNQESLFSYFNLYLTPKEPEKVLLHTETVGNYQLFKHQRMAAKNVANLLKQEPQKVLLHMPTGSGKTRTAMNIISDFIRINEPVVVIWLATTEELCNQAVEEFEKAWSCLGNRRIEIFRFWGDQEIDLDRMTEGFIVAGLPKIVSKSKGSKGRKFMTDLSDKLSFIIMDEAHQAIAPTYQFILDTLSDVGGKKQLLGLSATPGRTWDNREADMELANFFSKKKVKLEVEGYDNPVDYLTDSGYLAKVNFKPLIYNEGILTEKEKEKIRDGEISSALLSKLAEDEKRNLLIIKEAMRLVKDHQRVILFAPSVKSSNMISFILESQGVHSRTLTGQTDSRSRREIIEDFKNEDEISKVLCNYGVLTTGFDAPKTSAAIVGRPTVSLVLYSQMVGRAIRGINAGGNKEAEIVTIIDQDLPGFRSVAEAFENWEDVW